MKTIISNATVVPMTARGEVLLETDVFVDGSTIAGLGQEGRSISPAEADHVIDGRDKIILPGFINTHTHTPMTIMRGTRDGVSSPPTREDIADWAALALPHRWVETLTPDDHYWSSFLGIAEMIRAGTSGWA